MFKGKFPPFRRRAVGTYEVLLLESRISEEDWRRFLNVLLERLRPIARFTLCVTLDDHVIRFYIRSKFDLSAISHGLEVFVLCRIDGVANDERLMAPDGQRWWWWWRRLGLRGNVLAISERYQVLRHAEVRALKLRVTRVGTMLATKATVSMMSNSRMRKTVHYRKYVPLALLDFDFHRNVGYLKKSVPRYVSVEKSSQILARVDENALFQVDTFPLLPHGYFVHLHAFAFDKHSLFVGATGSGKSKLIELFVARLRSSPHRNRYRVIVIDPHMKLAQDLMADGDGKLIDFQHDSTRMFPEAGADVAASTELTYSLFRSLISGAENGHLERVLRLSLYVLNAAQSMSMENLRRFLQELDYRSQMLQHIRKHAPYSVQKFFDTEFNDIKNSRYGEAIQPIIALIDELQLQPMISTDGGISLLATVQENFLTAFSLSKVSMGDKAVKIVAGLLIQQIFLLAQAREFNMHVILIIDEVSVVENPNLAQILAEARKFGLTVFLTQQYFDQVSANLRSAILGNVTNYFVFRVSEKDAQLLAGNLAIDFPQRQLDVERVRGNDEATLKVRLMTDLSPRNCLVRVSAQGKLLPAVLARTVEMPVAKSKVPIKRSPASQLNRSRKMPSKFVFRDQNFDANADNTPNAKLAARPSSRDDAMTLTGVFAAQSAGKRERSIRQRSGDSSE